MSEIKRYCFEQVTENDCAMIEDAYGQYVTFDDHESRIKQLEQELAEAKKDQARYQWIVRDFDTAKMKLEDYLYTDFESLDDFIDSAIKESK